MASSDFHRAIKKDWIPKFSAFIDDIKTARDRERFPYNGAHIYAGWQGSGKTVSMVKHGLDLHAIYPKAIVVSNLELTGLKPVSFSLMEGMDSLNIRERQRFLTNSLRSALLNFDPTTEYLFFQPAEELAVLFRVLRNGKRGIIYLLDEAHLYFNSLDSKDVSPEIFATISQQRKNTTLILGSSQLFMRLAKPIREQAVSVIMCSTWFGFWTFQKYYDAHKLTQDDEGKLHGDVKKRGWFFQTIALRKIYDTFQIVISSEQIYDSPQMLNLDVSGLKNGKKR